MLYVTSCNRYLAAMVIRNELLITIINIYKWGFVQMHKKQKPFLLRVLSMILMKMVTKLYSSLYFVLYTV